MSATTVLIGGPKDGDVLAVRRWSDPILVTRLSEGMSASYWKERTRPTEEVGTHIETYEPERLSFFGVPILVHLHESLAFGKVSQTDLGHAIGEHLLSDKGKAAVLR